jgi:hypothetical protein
VVASTTGSRFAAVPLSSFTVTFLPAAISITTIFVRGVCSFTSSWMRAQKSFGTRLSARLAASTASGAIGPAGCFAQTVGCAREHTAFDATDDRPLLG